MLVTYRLVGPIRVCGHNDGLNARTQSGEAQRLRLAGGSARRAGGAASALVVAAGGIVAAIIEKGKRIAEFSFL